MSVTAARRRRCSNCNTLTDPAKLQRVGGRELLCPDCLLAEAERLAPALELDAGGELVYEPAAEAPAPLPLREEDERFEGFEEAWPEGWPLRKGRLSASALAQFLQCPEAFRRSYVLGDPTPTQGKMLAGTGAHGAIEATLRQVIGGGGLASPAQILATYDAVFDQAFTQAANRGGVEWGKAEKRELDADSARAIGREAVEAYAREALPQLLGSGVEAVEGTFSLWVPGCPVPIVGLIDVAGTRSTVDLKFGDKSASSVQSYWRVQARCYGVARRLPVDFHTATWAGKVQTPTTHPGLRYQWSAAEAVITARMIASVADSILMHADRLGRDQPWPGAITHPFCGSCDYRPDCSWWQLAASDLL